jgi:hypothetical protein
MSTPQTEANKDGAATGLALAPGSVTYALFKHMADEHGLTLLESEMAEIVRIVNDNLEARLRWWITNAEDIAKERGELFRAGEAMRAAYVAHIGTEKSARVKQWDAAAQPIRDMASSPNVQDEPRPAAAVGSSAWLGSFSNARKSLRKTQRLFFFRLWASRPSALTSRSKSTHTLALGPEARKCARSSSPSMSVPCQPMSFQ